MADVHPVGDVFTVAGRTVVVVPDAEGYDPCEMCAFYVGCIHPPKIPETWGPCGGVCREDGVDVHYEIYNDGHYLTRHLNEFKKSHMATDREQ